jgi:hypothetical protein
VLRTIDFSGTNLNDESVSAVFAARKPFALTRVLFVDCKHLTSVAATAVIQNSTNLVTRFWFFCWFCLLVCCFKEYLNLELGSATGGGGDDDPRRRGLKQIVHPRIVIRY